MSKTSQISCRMETVRLYEEYRLIEKDESEVNVAWRGVHLLLFFLAFMFGSFCTFCFHLLMYLFDEKCVLFPKMISLKDMKTNPSSTTTNKLLYDYISRDNHDGLPVDFVTTHWVEMSTCHLPAYVPLLSGICGLIWFTMFLMCSSGSRTLSGLQKPWRIMPTVFVFSMVIGAISAYTSCITQAGLDELCTKLGEITGSKTCSYTINVATLMYERRIRGVYQATQLTIISAWLHTCCWIGAAFTALLRVILVIDFRLVKVRVDLQGNIEKMLERHERHIKTDEFSNKDDYNSLRQTSMTSLKVRFVNKGFGTEPPAKSEAVLTADTTSKETVLFMSQVDPHNSQLSLLPEENRKLTIMKTSSNYPREYSIIVEMLHQIVDKIGTDFGPKLIAVLESNSHLARQQGLRNIQSDQWSLSSSSETDESVANREEAEQLAKKFKHRIRQKILDKVMTSSTLIPVESRIIPEIIPITSLKSNLMNTSVQTDEDKKQTVSQRVKISSTITPGSSHETLVTLKPPEEQVWKTPIEGSVYSMPDEKTGNFFTFWISTLMRNEDTLTMPKTDATTKLMKESVIAIDEKQDQDREQSGENLVEVKTELTTEDSDKTLNQIREEPGPSHTKQDKYKKTVTVKENPKKTDKKEKQD